MLNMKEEEFRAYIIDMLDEYKYVISDLKKEVKQLRKDLNELDTTEWLDECNRVESDLTDEIYDAQNSINNILSRLDSLEMNFTYLKCQ